MGCSATLNGLPKDCEASMGGIAEVWITNHDAVSNVTVDENIISAISLADSAKFKRYFFRRGTGSMTSTYSLDPASGANFVTTDLALQFNKMETAKRIEMSALAVSELAIIVKDNNGKYWYLGYNNPVTASAGDGATGQAFTDANKYGITLQDVSLQLPYEVSAEALDAIVD